MSLPKATAFLAVFSSPGPLVSLEEFHDWYNNEHIPLRLNHLPSFLTGARYSSLSSDSTSTSTSDHQASELNSPSWLAVYDITSTSTFSDPSYTRLRANRSPREKDLVNRLALLDRRTCVLVKDEVQKEDRGPSTGFALGNPTEWVYTHGMDVIPVEKESIRNALEEDDDDEKLSLAWSFLVDAAHGQGWIRTRFFRCIDSLRIGTTVSPTEASEQIMSRYLVVHEMEQKDDMDSLEERLAQLTLGFPNEGPDSSIKIAFNENNKWELYRAYPSLGQGNL